MLHRAKKQNPDSIVVAAGCYAQSAEEHLKEDAAVDLIIGNNKKKDLPEILEEFLSSREQKTPQSYVIDISKAQDYEDLHIRKIADHTRAFLKVQTDATSSAVTASSPIPEGGSAAGDRKK